MENNSDTEMELYEEIVGDVNCPTPNNSRAASPQNIGLQFFQATSFRRAHCRMYSVSPKKFPPRVFWKFFPNDWEFLINFLHTYYAIIYTLDYEFLFKYLQLWQSYAILSATT